MTLSQLALTVGKQSLPFTQEGATSSKELITIDRSNLANNIWFSQEYMPGVSVFYKDPNGDIYHTYSAYSRGIDLLNGAYNYIDLTPRGRDEGTRGQFWVRRHDRYED